MNSICENCGFVGQAVTERPGSGGAQVALFILGLLTFGVVLLVWLAYVAWRIFKTELVCPSCKKPKTMIALDSPRGKKLQREFAESA